MNQQTFMALCLGGVVTFAPAQEATTPARTQYPPEQIFAFWDENGDGELTPDEVPNANLLKFVDKNGDGVVSKDEATAIGKWGAAPGGRAVRGASDPAPGANDAVLGSPDPAQGTTGRSPQSGRPAVGDFGGVGRPAPSGSERPTIPGNFIDIGGTDLVPDFGGFYHDSAKDKAGPDINLCDLDNDGDLDLIPSFHCDVLDWATPHSPIEYRQGVFCWKNLLAETGTLRFERVSDNGRACEAHLKLSADKRSTEPVGKAPGLPYISLADVDNDGLLDVLAVGPASPGWAPRAEYASGRFWRNRGGFPFEEATDAAGLPALNWVYRDWCQFFEMPAPQDRPGAPMQPGDRRPYFADAVFGDYDNDGWQDLVVLDRHESPNGCVCVSAA